MQPITLLGVALCFLVLFLKYQAQRGGAQSAAQLGDQPRRTRSQKLKTAKILWAALLVWMAVGYALQRLNANIDGTAPPPSLMERVVTLFSN